MALSGSSLSDALTKDFLSCKICLEQFKKPKILPCLHTYCEACLEELNANGQLRCPECREEITLSVGSLKTNFFINSLLDLIHSTSENDLTCTLCPLINKGSSQEAVSRCLDCSDNMCHICANGHRYSRLTYDHQVVSICDYVAGKYDEEIRLRQAVKCQLHQGEHLRFLCTQCASLICRECRVTQHLDHECLSLSEAAESRKPVIKGLLEGVERHIRLISSGKASTEEYLQQLRLRESCIKKTMEEAASMVIKQLHSQQQDILERLGRFVKEHEKACELLRSDLDFQEQVARSTMTVAEKVLSLGKETEILSLEKMITERLQGVQGFRWNPVPAAYPELTLSAALQSCCNVFQLSFQSGQAQKPNAEDGGSSCPSKQDHQKGPTAVPLKSTPLARKPIFFCSFRTRIPTETKKPKITGICSFGCKEILVADEENRSLKRFSIHGDYKGSIPVQDNKAPCGIAVLKNKIIYSVGSVIYLVDDGGTLIWKNALPDTQASHAFTTTGDNQVAITTTGYVDLYSLEGEKIKRIYPNGEWNWKLIFLTTNHKGHFVASDWYKKSVVVFDKSGNILHWCEDMGFETRLPGAVSVDGKGNIYITIHELSKIISCSPEGKFIGEFLTSKNGIERPRVTAILDDEHFAVALNNGNIHIFKF
ncbi:E3 ubiquitin-protein ligase TRIM56 [Rhinatrema bivittatum]|uniref:E3 ubiquitin-protein ligase TRIM56 n=1 Tax=Rhinatrema bivittatum TaxID=194408 RepID=UPI0011273A93|nr:E3 ubiquitin-protein ligase TRIM56 [Rhinatrema bivittatum]XP_029436120.1 E3 ubiquitin-protein ligase TRIM56 [Rhinatrema bivittatum]XP_029436121.1 E3 ubiquitin-protein ligase TRIM56 [Rhinatrema bivittatum]XP_029436122.1 E3 ubiquitin-protein ligase TRIM56 [Rhinatrema bivittatum]XP_029436123.1 E3 ubiquitin-protein ligase TRIM56 [Rhinatrema bivittatum]XP_029436124.1 E3 ubiquitin-protein ligase TRIM56 [Rhinatrema bivittatum]